MANRLPLHEEHAARGAKFGTFGDWEVPLYYRGILEEHRAVRQAAGLFDISHMGEFWIWGAQAEAFLQALLPRDLSHLIPGQAQYMPLLQERGGILDDILVYRFSSEEFLLVVNAANIEKDFAWFKSHLFSGAQLQDQSETKGLLALQGPASSAILAAGLGPGFQRMKYYHVRPWKSGMIARTGYTGEDGFEILADQKELSQVWDRLFEAGEGQGLVPAGFGARDTLRLEAGMLLYGHDMSDETTPFEAGIGWAVDLKKENFMGREALLEKQRQGLKRRLVGFEMQDRGIPRQGYPVKINGEIQGEVTSGSFSPTLGKNIGLAYVPARSAEAGQEVEIMIRGTAQKAKVVKLPFYKGKK